MIKLSIEQQQAMVGMLRERFSNHPRLRYVDLGQGVVDLEDNALCYDGLHLTAQGNAQIADHLVLPVLEVLGHSRGVVHVVRDGQSG